MKIAFFTQNTHAGGLDSVLIALVNNWPNKSDDLTIICNKSHPGLEIIEKRIRRPCRIIRHNLPIDSDFLMKIRKIPGSKFLRILLIPHRYALFAYYLIILRISLFKNNPYDRLMVVAGGYPGGDTCRAAVIVWGIINKKKRAIFNFHNLTVMPNKYLKWIEYPIDWMVGYFSRHLITVSNASAQSMKKRPMIWRTGKVFHIYNGIEVIDDENIVHGKSLRDEIGVSAETKLCLMMSVYEPRKGHDFLLRSFREVIKKLPTAHLVISGYGTPAEFEAVCNIVKQYGLSSNVHLFGFRNDRSNLLKNTDVLLVSSQSFESFGLTCVEAMSHRIPVLATQVGGLPEVVIDEEGGYCLPPDDVNGYASKIIELLENDSLRKEQGEKGYQRYKKYFTAERMTSEYASYVSK